MRRTPGYHPDSGTVSTVCVRINNKVVGVVLVTVVLTNGETLVVEQNGDDNGSGYGVVDKSPGF